jgi:hypothetical protein
MNCGGNLAKRGVKNNRNRGHSHRGPTPILEVEPMVNDGDANSSVDARTIYFMSTIVLAATWSLVVKR